MNYKANSPEEYIVQLPEERQKAVRQIRKIIQNKLPKEFEEQMSYGMIGYVIPHTLYPKGYHCDNKLPLPFINIASQKKFIALYHTGIYADKNLLDWFVAEYPKHCKRKLDMGKSCVRFKYMDDIPYDLIGELCTKMSADKWIKIYEKNVKRT